MRNAPKQAQARLAELLEVGPVDRSELARSLVELGAAHAVVVADLGWDHRGVVTRCLVVQGVDRGAVAELSSRTARGPLPDFSRPDPRALQVPVVPGPRGAGPLVTGPSRIGGELRVITGTEDDVRSYLGLFGAPGVGIGRGWRGALTALAPALRRWLDESFIPACGVEGPIAVDAEGGLIAADGRVGPWLEARDRLARLPAVLRVGRQGDTVEGPLDGARVRLRAARGRLGAAWLGTVTSPGPVDRSLDGLLTPTQREVAGFAAAGATCAEIAGTLGTRVETVRTHVRDIYSRLGISSRAELARRWAPLLDQERLAG